MRKKIGLALGSGGWRSLAHIGVIKTLEKHDIKIDYIAGCSGGSLIGGVYAHYKDIDKVTRIFDNFGYKDFFEAFSDLYLGSGFIKGNKAVTYLEKYLKKNKLEDTRIPFKAVATDYSTGKEVVLDNGLLSTAIRASCSVPLLFDPVFRGDKYLVDGAVCNPVPVNVVKSMGADIVIGVDLYKNIIPANKSRKKEKDFLSRKEILASSYQLLLRNLSAISVKEADIIIQPNLKEQGMGLFALHKFITQKDTVNTGRDAMEEHIKDLKKLLVS